MNSFKDGVSFHSSQLYEWVKMEYEEFCKALEMKKSQDIEIPKVFEPEKDDFSNRHKPMDLFIDC